LVTGVPGWLGNRLVKILVKGLPDLPELSENSTGRLVRCLYLPNSDIKHILSLGKNVSCIKGDITKPETLINFFQDVEGSTLFHIAGIVHPMQGIRQLYRVNVEGTKNVLRSAVVSGIKRVIIVSSNSPVGCNPHQGHLFDETSPYNPYLSYGRSKMIMEKMVHEISESGSIEIVIIRPPWFYGPDQPPRQTLFFKMIRDGKMPIVGSGKNLRSMAYVDNICQGLLLCEKVENAKGKIYWIADACPYSMNEIVDTVENLLEDEFNIPVKHKRLKLPCLAGNFAERIDRAFQSIGRYNEKIHVLGEMNKNIACSIERARDELGYDPKINLEEGMRRAITWCLERGLIK
jgi:nucleoside-diphosphate-sugar epimerase